MTDKAIVKITLTPEQQALIEQSSGQRVKVVELKPEALERRVTPGVSLN